MTPKVFRFYTTMLDRIQAEEIMRERQTLVSVNELGLSEQNRSQFEFELQARRAGTFEGHVIPNATRDGLAAMGIKVTEEPTGRGGGRV